MVERCTCNAKVYSSTLYGGITFLANSISIVSNCDFSLTSHNMVLPRLSSKSFLHLDHSNPACIGIIALRKIHFKKKRQHSIINIALGLICLHELGSDVGFAIKISETVLYRLPPCLPTLNTILVTIIYMCLTSTVWLRTPTRLRILCIRISRPVAEPGVSGR